MNKKGTLECRSHSLVQHAMGTQKIAWLPLTHFGSSVCTFDSTMGCRDDPIVHPSKILKPRHSCKSLNEHPSFLAKSAYRCWSCLTNITHITCNRLALHPSKVCKAFSTKKYTAVWRRKKLPLLPSLSVRFVWPRQGITRKNNPPTTGFIVSWWKRLWVHVINFLFTFERSVISVPSSACHAYTFKLSMICSTSSD